MSETVPMPLIKKSLPKPRGNVHKINLSQDTAVVVNDKGEVLGESAEGTLGIILKSGHPGSYQPEKQCFGVEKAVKIPRLLQSNASLNFHVAEIGYHEGKQAIRFPQRVGVLGAGNFFLLSEANVFTKMPGTGDGQCFVGFYLSSTKKNKICLVSQQNCWPAEFNALVEERGLKTSLFQKLKDRAGTGEGFQDLLFIPESRTDNPEIRDTGVMDLCSGEFFDLTENKGISGWWFNLPIAVYPWMTTNLERLMTGMLEQETSEEKDHSVEKLECWELYHWLVLIKHLTLGLYEIHRIKAIHGDPRPANIMADTPDGEAITPESFRWIDVGLGYGAEESGHDLEEQTPRPLGGSRNSVFYAPERSEGNEFEDADSVHLEKTRDGMARLSFYWKERTNRQSKVMRLRDSNQALKALGELKKGDRIQVREFVFTIAWVEEDAVVVSKVFELFLDRVLVEKKGAELEEVYDRLNHAPIARYKIYYEWSQATDIYGLGIIVLYCFFIRGLQRCRENDEPYDYANREQLFEELVSVMKNRCFLENFLQSLKSKGFGDLQELLQPDVYELDAQKIDEIMAILYAADTNFVYILQGLSGNYGLFLQVVYFCLSCLWRQNDIEELIRKSEFPFAPFAYSRHFDSDNSAHAAENARVFIEKVIKIFGRTAALNERTAESELTRVSQGGTRIDQVLRFMGERDAAEKKLKEAERRIKDITVKYKEAEGRIKGITEKCSEALQIARASSKNVLARASGKNIANIQEILEGLTIGVQKG